MVPLLFLGLPGQVWLSVLIACVIGVLILLLAYFFKSKEWKFWGELTRDIGIAFVVAAVVSAVYEYSTRSIAEHETLLDTINRAMKAVVPGNVWDEVRTEILHRRALRRNVRIDMKITRDAVVGGRRIQLPPDFAVLHMSYSYDLYGIAAGQSKVEVRHELANEMWNDDLQLPRFESVIVREPGGERRYDAVNLAKISPQRGVVDFDVTLPPPTSGQAVSITTDRYELVRVPGSYNLIMPELTACADRSPEPTIRVSISALPSDVDARLDTYYPPHKFVRAGGVQNEWLFNDILLPGQGFTLLLQRHE